MNKIIKFLVFVLALLQPLVAYLSRLGDASRLTSVESTPLITPAGYAFTIWGVICVGSVIYGLYQLFATRNADLYTRIAPYSIFVFAGFTVWLYAAQRDWFWGTLLIFIVMAFCLYRLFSYIVNAVRHGRLTGAEKLVTYGTFGFYAGWSTVAIFANLAAIIKFSGISDAGRMGSLWQTVILILAACAALWCIRKFRASLPYTLAIVWAFVAIIIGTAQKAPQTILPWVAAIALVIIVATYFLRRRNTRLGAIG